MRDEPADEHGNHSGRVLSSGRGCPARPSAPGCAITYSHAGAREGLCRRCRAVIAKGETRLEVCAFVRPGRYTLLLRCTAPACIDAPLSAAILLVYKIADRVPVDAVLEGSAEAQRVVRAITSAGPNA